MRFDDSHSSESIVEIASFHRFAHKGIYSVFKHFRFVIRPSLFNRCVRHSFEHAVEEHFPGDIEQDDQVDFADLGLVDEALAEDSGKAVDDQFLLTNKSTPFLPFIAFSSVSMIVSSGTSAPRSM